MTIAEIALFTDDVSAVSSFYAGLAGRPPVAEWPGGALFELGAGKLLVHERSRATDGGPPNEDHFAIGVRDLDSSCGALAASGFAFLVEARDYPWGRSAYLLDPDGRLVELTQS